jgi:ABC-type transport system involved in cytochrome c biogenesis permease subunit
MYISGRPPVTNLYSSAVFIGWGCVLVGLILERVYRVGLGNTVAAVAGAKSLIIAHLLMTQAPADRGDTMAVLQAVLDTQFWLATHVVCVTMGYATTILAGWFGLVYVIRGLITRDLTPELSKDLARMTYGTICFAMLFSFFGTVLGGLWADDSWGRFWGWDPKENGALIIVLWNALVLHARWGGMVKERGLAVLAIGGNIVTAWSWFGTNELRVGLHSYGFTEGALLVLGLFVGSQLLAIAAGMLPKSLWANSASANAAS